MQKKKAVFLFGAGAVMDWGGPRTLCKGERLTFIPDHNSSEANNRPCCLTHLLTGIGFIDKDDKRITQKIFESLKAKNADANFETILNVIEDLYAYWALQHNGASNNLYSILDVDDQIEDFSCFEIISEGGLNYISIPGVPLPENSEKWRVNGMHPKQKYYELLLNCLLIEIQKEISKYAYHSQTGSVIKRTYNADINKNFTRWICGLVEENYSLRMYTLNYDRLFKVLLKEQGIDLFEGFDLDEISVPHGKKVKTNLSKIITDFDSNVHYNLHGSVYWKLDEYNGKRMPGYQYLLAPLNEIENYSISIEIEKGKKLLLTNIISGYQKVQRTAISPFRQMLSAFDRDCFEADRLYLIGYSLGDEHINDIIRNAKKYNSELEIVIVTPEFEEKEKKEFKKNFIIHWGCPLDTWTKNEVDNSTSSPFKVQVIQEKFGDFLKTQ